MHTVFPLIIDHQETVDGRTVSFRVRHTHQGAPLGAGAALRLGRSLTDGAGRCQCDDPGTRHFVSGGTPHPAEPSAW